MLEIEKKGKGRGKEGKKGKGNGREGRERSGMGKKNRVGKDPREVHTGPRDGHFKCPRSF